MQMDNKTKCYTLREKALLVQLVKGNEVIENKKTDAVTTQEKNEAWNKLCNMYNSQPEVETVRRTDQLKKLWNNLKQKKRKENTELRHSMLATGGGPSAQVSNDVIMDLIEDAAPNVDISIDNPYDTTAAFETDEGNVQPVQSKVTPSFSSDEFLRKPLAGAKHESSRDQTPGITRARRHKDALLIKNQEGLIQHQELHEIRMEIAREELKRAKAETELAVLKLQDYKNNLQ